MSTRKQLEAEAAGLYPELPATTANYQGWNTYRAIQRAAHVRAKTVTAEQVEAAAWEYLHYTLTPNPGAARQSEWGRARRIVTTTFRAAGFYVMEATMTDPCANTDQCHYWPRHDDRCHRTTEAHSAMCSEHAEHDYGTWWESHAAEDCCPDCCEGEIEHE